VSSGRGEVRLYWEFEEIEGETFHATGVGGAGPLYLCEAHYAERRSRAEERRRAGAGHYLDIHPVPSNRQMAEMFKMLKGADPKTQAHLDETIRTLSRGETPELETELAGRTRLCHDRDRDQGGPRESENDEKDGDLPES